MLNIKKIAVIALLSTSVTFAAFTVQGSGKDATSIIGAMKNGKATGKTKIVNSNLSATSTDSNGKVEQIGLANINRNGSIDIARGVKIQSSTIRAKSSQRNTKVRQVGLTNLNENGTVVVN